MATFENGYIHTPILSQVHSRNQSLISPTDNDCIKRFISHSYLLSSSSFLVASIYLLLFAAEHAEIAEIDKRLFYSLCTLRSLRLKILKIISISRMSPVFYAKKKKL
jgi:hypothetical protein